MTITLSWNEAGLAPEIKLLPPPGETITRLRWLRQANYIVGRIARPKAGVWRARVRSARRLHVVMAALLRSPARLRLDAGLNRGRITLSARVRHGKQAVPATIRATVVSPLLGRAGLSRLKLGAVTKPRGVVAPADFPAGVARLASARALAARSPGGDPLAYRRTVLAGEAKRPASTPRLLLPKPEVSGPRSIIVRAEAAPVVPGPPIVRLSMRSFP